MIREVLPFLARQILHLSPQLFTLWAIKAHLSCGVTYLLILGRIAPGTALLLLVLRFVPITLLPEDPDVSGDCFANQHRARDSRYSQRALGQGTGGASPAAGRGCFASGDKIVQRAVAEVMNAIYEEDFLGLSYGFRLGRSPHHALDALATGILRKRVNWVLDADIRGYFDAISHEWLRRFLEHRIADKRFLRLIQKWLSAGVVEEGRRSETEQGTPQGATISPLLANVYLHYVFDLWADRWRRQHARGDVVIVRFADDIVIGFQHRLEAERFWQDLRERFARFCLELHSEKTRLLEFGGLAASNRRKRGLGKPETFDFLGFTHICGKSKKGRFLLMRKTVRTRMRAKLRAVKTELARRRHLSIPQQGAWLGSVVRGHFAYYAVPTNVQALSAFRTEAISHWKRALERRSQRGRVSWTRMARLQSRWVPRARILHPWPEQRFDARTRGRSPVR